MVGVSNPFLVGDGPELFSVSAGRPRLLADDGNWGVPPGLVDFAEHEAPAEAPPFLLHDGKLSGSVRDQILRRSWSWDYLIDAQVVDVTWRQPLQHIELNNFVSVEVFEQLAAIAPGAFVELHRMVLHPPNKRGNPREYVYFRVERYTNSGTGLVRELCEPPIPAGERHVAKFLRQHLMRGESAVLAFADEMARDDAVLLFSEAQGRRWCVTGAFRDAWLAADISQLMRSTNGEYDYDFQPSVGGFGGDNVESIAKGHGVVRYRWVDTKGERRE